MEIKLEKCPLCGKNVRIDSGCIECTCGLRFRLNNGFCDLQKWIDKHWNSRVE